MTSLYLHIPFCNSRCGYCSFASCVADDRLKRRYVNALISEITNLCPVKGGDTLQTLFVGGGTPTTLPSSLLPDLVRFSLESFQATSVTEVSVEANPGTVDSYSLSALLKAGVNRLSIGVQSFNTAELHVLGRSHSARQALAAMKNARSAGFDNINLDLMYGIPGQTTETLRISLETALSCQPEHLSIYQLSIEPGTSFSRIIEAGELLLPCEDVVLEMDEVIVQLCGGAGFERYEISNFAQPGYRCKHNITYWKNEEYLAAGASAVSFSNGIRGKREVDPRRYIELMESGEVVVQDQECLERDSSFRETVVMGLRLLHGVSLERLAKRFGLHPVTYYGPDLARLVAYGFIEIEDGYMRLSSKGLPVANTVMAELV